MKTSDLYIKETSEKGKPMDIRLPDGKIIESALTVLGADSNAFADEMATARRAEIELLDQKEKLSPVEYSKRQKAIRENMLSVLVTGWTFEEPFNRAAVNVLFINAPYVLEQVDNFASIRENFFAKQSMG